MPRVGQVGCGLWGRHILRDLVALGCTVEVVARSDQSRARASEGGAERIAASLDELGEVDGIVVATPEDTHAAVIGAALDRGVPVFTEKPMTVDPQSAERLAGTAPERLFVMDKWRYHPGIEALRDIARSGELGRPVGLALKRLGWGHAHPSSDSIWHLAPHDVAITLEVLGTLPEPRDAVVESLDGRPAGMSALLGDDPWVTIEVSSAYPEHHREVRLSCEEGVAWLANAMAPEIVVGRASDVGGEPERREIGSQMPLERELAAFIEHLEGGPPPRSSAAEGAANVATLGRLRELAGLPAGSPERGTSRHTDEGRGIR